MKSGLLPICLKRNCQRLLMPYVDGELDAASRSRLENHLQRCARCRAECEQLQFDSRLVSQLRLPEASPAGIPAWTPPKGEVVAPAGFRINWRIAIPATAMLVFIVASTLWIIALKPWLKTQQPQPYPFPQAIWEAQRLSGTPRIGTRQMEKTEWMEVGEALETDSVSRAMIRIGVIGQVEIDPDSHVKLLAARPNERKISLTRGRIFAHITAPPRIFMVETPAGLAVDLGCSYILEVDDVGITRLEVLAGWVALPGKEKEIAVPAGAICYARPGVGAGTPFSKSASKKLQDAIDAFDTKGAGIKALGIILSEATKGDIITLWTLLKNTDTPQRERVYKRLAEFVPPPDGVTEEGIMQLDSTMLRQWGEKLQEFAQGLQKPLPLAKGSIAVTGNLEFARYLHTATLLSTGKILVTGGIGVENHRASLASAELYDPASGTFSRTSDMNAKRAGHTATRLLDGKVLIVGGSSEEDHETGTVSAEIYDPSTGRFTPTGNMNVPRSRHSATLLPDGKVLIVGGLGIDPNAPYLASAELYDPVTGTSKLIGNLDRPSANHTATLLANGKVLIAGGIAAQNSYEQGISGAEIFDPATNHFQPTGKMVAERFKHSAVLLPDGRVFIAGGAPVKYNAGQTFYNSTEIYDPATGTFSPAATMLIPRFKISDSTVLLPDGKVLIAGGGWGMEIYDPTTNSFRVRVDGLKIMRYHATATLLANGDVVMIGGYSEMGYMSTPLPLSNASAWIYHVQ